MKLLNFKIHYLIILIGIFFGNISVTSQTLEDYLRMAAENSPDLKAKFLSYQAALERVPQGGALPDPQLSFGIFLEPMERYMGNQVAEISIMQMFPWFGTLGAARDELAAMAKARYEEFNEAKNMLFYEVKSNWYALYLLKKEIAITEENIEILNSLEEIAISRLKSGGVSSTGGSTGSEGMQREQTTGTSDMDGMGMGTQRQPTPGTTQRPQNMNSMNEMSSSGSMADVLRVQIEVNEMRNNLSLLNVNLHHMMTGFNNLLNRQAHESINIPDTVAAVLLPAPVSQIPDSIKLNNPMLRMLHREEEAFSAQEKMNRRMGFPMVGIGLQYDVFRTRPGTMMPASNMLMPMVTVSLPIWRSKYNASVQESRYMREAVIEQRTGEGNRLMVNYEDALTEYHDARRRVEFYIQQILLAQQVLNILTTQYTTAGSAIEEILRMQQQLLDYRLRGLDAVVDQNIAVAMLERLMGR
jgi:outer membrane protein TolC